MSWFGIGEAAIFGGSSLLGSMKSSNASSDAAAAASAANLEAALAAIEASKEADWNSTEATNAAIENMFNMYEYETQRSDADKLFSYNQVSNVVDHGAAEVDRLRNGGDSPDPTVMADGVAYPDMPDPVLTEYNPDPFGNDTTGEDSGTDPTSYVVDTRTMSPEDLAKAGYLDWNNIGDEYAEAEALAAWKEANPQTAQDAPVDTATDTTTDSTSNPADAIGFTDDMDVTDLTDPQADTGTDTTTDSINDTSIVQQDNSALTVPQADTGTDTTTDSINDTSIVQQDNSALAVPQAAGYATVSAPGDQNLFGSISPTDQGGDTGGMISGAQPATQTNQFDKFNPNFMRQLGLSEATIQQIMARKGGAAYG